MSQNRDRFHFKNTSSTLVRIQRRAIVVDLDYESNENSNETAYEKIKFIKISHREVVETVSS